MNHFSDFPFMPHGVCWRWDPVLVLLHAASDLLTFAAYVVIPAVALWIYRQANLKSLYHAYPVLWRRGALFVLCCGLSHLGSFAEVWIGGWLYYATGINKALLALASFRFASEFWRRRAELVLTGRILAMAHKGVR